jgi:diguanylate cyclase (GGDEF)-like protein
MQKLPVTRDGRRGSHIIMLDSSEIVKIEIVRDKQYVIHTADSLFYLDITLESIEEWLYEDGFRMLDSGNIVNMNHVSQYDLKKGIVFLGDPTLKQTKTASAARIHKDHIENLMQMLTAMEHEKTKVGYSEFNEAPSSLIIQNPDERFTRSYDMIRLVEEKKWTEKKMYHMAYHDALTNLPNRLLFKERLEQCLEESRQQGTMLAIIFMDIDRFKNINDTLGHYIGDQLLIYLSEKLKGHKREEDMICRFSGDEFIFLLTNISHVDEATVFAKSIADLLKQPFMSENQELYVTSSIGISLYPQDGLDPDQLIKNADTAMYRAKEQGGDTYQLYHSDMNKHSLKRLHLESYLRKALDKNEFICIINPLLICAQVRSSVQRR